MDWLTQLVSHCVPALEYNYAVTSDEYNNRNNDKNK